MPVHFVEQMSSDLNIWKTEVNINSLSKFAIFDFTKSVEDSSLLCILYVIYRCKAKWIINIRYYKSYSESFKWNFNGRRHRKGIFISSTNINSSSKVKCIFKNIINPSIFFLYFFALIIF